MVWIHRNSRVAQDGHCIVCIFEALKLLQLVAVKHSKQLDLPEVLAQSRVVFVFER